MRLGHRRQVRDLCLAAGMFQGIASAWHPGAGARRTYRRGMAKRKRSRNPGKNPGARRRRAGLPGAGRAGYSMDDVYGLLADAPPAALPLFALTALWLWNLAQDRHAAAHCIDGCLTLHHALAEYGIASRIETVAIWVQDLRPGRPTGDVFGQDPHFSADGTFTGHTVLVATGARRFIDPTIQRFTPGTGWDMRQPLVAPLPAPDGLGDVPIGIPRGHLGVAYAPLPAYQQQAWRCAAVAARDADFRQTGENLAVDALALLQLPDMRPRALQSPYPRLQLLLAGGTRVLR